MASDLEAKAKEAFIDDHFELAIDLYSQAIQMDGSSRAELFVDRAQSYIKHEKFTEAIADANRAIELEPSMAKAYLRKGVACMKLQDYQNAKKALQKGTSLVSEDSRFMNLIKECDKIIAEEASSLTQQSLEKQSSNYLEETVQAAVDSKPVVANTLVSSTKLKYRHEFYQKPEEVVVTIFAKAIPNDSVAIEFGDQILSVSINVPGEEYYHFQPRLFGKIVPAKCKYAVLGTKIEIRLFKDEPIYWKSLEFCKDNPISQKINVSSVQKPMYPTSKPKFGLDWDLLEAQMKKEEKDEKLEGDAAVNKFFRQIYADADEDTRRAMSKSFVESNGTVLSTDWKDVGSKKIEGSPPQGMEMKKW